MKKLDKKALADKYSELYVNLASKETRFAGYLAGLEYAESHYLKIIEEKDKQVIESAQNTLNIVKIYNEKLQTAKELLKNIYKTSVLTTREKEEIEEFLKQ